MKNIHDIQCCIKNKNAICLIFDYEGVLSSYAKTFSADSFNPMIKRILENYAKKDYIKVVILLPEDDKKILKKLKMSAKNLEFNTPETFDVSKLYENMDEKMRLVYFGDNIDIINKIKEIQGVSVCIDYIPDDVRAAADFLLTKNKLEEFIIQTNNLYL